MSDLERDAMRYRWLREISGMNDRPMPGNIEVIMTFVEEEDGVDVCFASPLSYEQMDKAIDASMMKWASDASTAH